MKKIKYFVAILCMFLLFSCPFGEYGDEDYITVKNSSENNVYMWMRTNSIELPTIPPSENRIIYVDGEIIWGEHFTELLSDDGILYVWIFDEDVINNTPWEEIVENGEDFIWSELTLQELIDMNWIIEYDGN